MSEFSNIVITQKTVVCLVITAVLLFVVPLVYWIYWQKNHKGQLKLLYLLAGAAGFIVCARMLEAGVHVLCLMVDSPVSRFISGSTVAYVIYGILMAGIFEECGRYVILKFIMKQEKTRENAVLYGIGHGGVEAWTVFIPAVLSQLTIAAVFMNRELSEALDALGITEETAASALPTVLGVANFGVGMLILTVVERIFTMFIHIGLTVVVFYGVAAKKKICLLCAILLHMVVDVLPALYQRGVVPMWLSDIWVAILAVIIVYFAMNLYQKINSGEKVE